MDYEWLPPAAFLIGLMAIPLLMARARGAAERRKLKKAQANNPYAVDKWIAAPSEVNSRLVLDVDDLIKLNKSWALERVRVLQSEIFNLRDDSFEKYDPAMVLRNANSEEMRAFLEIVDGKGGGPEDLIMKLRVIGTNAVRQFWKGLKSVEQDEINSPYSVLLSDSARNVGVRLPSGESIYASELRIMKAAFNKMLERMSPDERGQLLSTLAKKETEQSYGKEMAVGGGIVAAQLSGFGIYLASSTVVGAVTSAIGVTLPFAAYTGMSSAISVVIGPVGWVALGGWLIYKAGRPDANRVTAGILLIANIRHRLIHERDLLVSDLEIKRDWIMKVYLPRLLEREAEIERYSKANRESVKSRFVKPGFFGDLQPPENVM